MLLASWFRTSVYISAVRPTSRPAASCLEPDGAVSLHGMAATISYYSTNRRVPPVSLADALLQGQAADRGLFMPDAFPRFTPAELAALRGRPYADVALVVLRRYAGEMLPAAQLAALCATAYDFPVPLEHVSGRTWVMRLDRGPTASFKDFAARMMARWMGTLVARDERELIILTATSGDTGSAVAHAYHGVPGVRVIVLFPPAEVSDRQRKQMTTLGGNVTTLAIDGQFDDCQALVKQAFADPELRGLRLTSANSINIGRLLPQSVYYLYACVNLTDPAAGEPIVFSVPSGNFGDMMGAVIAAQMGLPLRRLVIATNANNEVPEFLRTGQYQKIAPSRACISNAMNVGHPSNLARLVDVYGGELDETGTLRRAPDLARMRRELYAVSISDAETRATIQQAYAVHRLLLEPHGAVGWAGLQRFLAEHPSERETPAVSVETAHPAKFPDEIRALLGFDPEVPPSLAGLDARTEQYGRLPATYGAFRDWLRDHTS
jgi:threonine synthase